MSAFDKVIGYDAIKDELLRICDMLKNPEKYKKLGASLPGGILLKGDPGLGKSLTAKCFLEECALPSFTLRRTLGRDEFIKEIARVFSEAKQQAPSVVLLDDLDKFADTERPGENAGEYVAVQAGIDEVKGTGVFVLATANETDCLPDSLTRPGRFDRWIIFSPPENEDAEKIIRHYLADKPLSPDVSFENLAKMISYSSCAELEAVLNDAASSAAFAGKESIGMAELIRSVLNMLFPVSSYRMSHPDRERIALHEAGHLVVKEITDPGSVGFACIRPSRKQGETGGCIHSWRKHSFSDLSSELTCLLAGKAAVELFFGQDVGCTNDLDQAVDLILAYYSDLASGGFSLLPINGSPFRNPSDALTLRNETALHSELEKALLRAKEILLENREFLMDVNRALLEKEILLYSDIRSLYESNRNRKKAV